MEIVHFIILVLILFFASKLAWKYSPRFISRRERYRNSDFKILQVRLGMIGSTCVIVGYLYCYLFIPSLVGQKKPFESNKTTTSDTSGYVQSIIPINKIKHKVKKETSVIDSATKSKDDTDKK